MKFKITLLTCSWATLTSWAQPLLIDFNVLTTGQQLEYANQQRVPGV
jgi:hypothetical protein